MINRYKPKPIQYKGSYIGVGVGPILQRGSILTKTQVRDSARNLSRSLSDEALETFMDSIKIVGIHSPERSAEWEWCPLKQIKGFCPCCTHIFVVAVSNYQSMPVTLD